MSPLILRTAVLFVFPLLILFAIFLLIRGHDEPGGGFVGGLVAAAAFALVAIAHGTDAARRSLRADTHLLVGAGLLTAAASGVWPLVRGEPFLAGRWADVPSAGHGEVALGTPLLFDAGVFLVVAGVTLKIVLAFMEEE